MSIGVGLPIEACSGPCSRQRRSCHHDPKARIKRDSEKKRYIVTRLDYPMKLIPQPAHHLARDFVRDSESLRVLCLISTHESHSRPHSTRRYRFCTVLGKGRNNRTLGGCNVPRRVCADWDDIQRKNRSTEGKHDYE